MKEYGPPDRIRSSSACFHLPCRVELDRFAELPTFCAGDKLPLTTNISPFISTT
jgi:hypothetical protein